MARVARSVPLLVIVSLVLGLGWFGLAASNSATEKAEAIHRADAQTQQDTLAGLTDQYLMIAAKEAFDETSTAPYSLVAGDPADHARLERFIGRSALYDYGAALVDLNQQPLTTYSKGPLPPATDPGYLGLITGLLNQKPGVSALLTVGQVHLVAVGVPVLDGGIPKAVLIGYWRAAESELQEYNERLATERSPNNRGFVVDPQGRTVTAYDRERVGDRLEGNPVVPLVSQGKKGITEFQRGGQAMTAIYSPIELGGWGLINEVPSSEFYGPIRSSHERATKALVALLAVAAVGLALLNHRFESLRRRNEDRFRSLVQNASDIVTVVDAGGTIVYDSPAVERILGYGPGERLGQPARSFLHPDSDQHTDALLHEVMASAGAVVRSEAQLRRKDGSYVWFEVTITNQVHDPSVRGRVVNLRDITERIELHEQLTHQAFHDSLTGLPNRALFQDRLRHALSRRLENQQVAVLFLDLDRFKIVNDSLGHECGDRLLVQVADRLRTCLRDHDTLARLSGDEFTILLDDVVDPDEPERVAERLIDSLRQPFSIAGRELFIGVSIGIALGRDQQPDELVRDADLAMYRAKERGRLRYEVFAADLGTRARQRLELEADLRQAIESGQLVMHYQPEIELSSGRVTSIEALARWDHPTRGLLPPAQFIALAEETGLIGPLGEWALRTACEQAQELRREPALEHLRVSVNISGRQMHQSMALIGAVSSVLASTGLPPSALILELTESVLMEDADGSISTLRALRALGVGVAIDDFGSGYSSLHHLKHFPVSSLKLDRSFVLGLGDDGADAAIAKAMIGLAHSLHIYVTAEGVELPQQLALLGQMGCDRAQGFHLARPAPADEVVALLRAWESAEPKQ